MASDGQRTEPVNLWTNRRIIFLALVVGLILYAIFKLPPTINYLLLRAREILVMLVLSVALAYFLLPTVKLLERIPLPLPHRTKREAATLAAMLLLAALFIVLVVLISQPMASELTRLGKLTTEWVKALPDLVQTLVARYSHLIPPQWQAWIQEQLSAQRSFGPPVDGQTGLAGALLQKMSEWTGALVTWQANLIKNVAVSGRYLIALLILPVFAYYFITDATKIRAGFRALMPSDACDAYDRMVLDVHRVLQGYVGALIVISIGTGVAMAVALYLTGVSVYLTFGILAGVANLIPVVGPVTAGVLICAITLMQAGWQAMLLILAIYLAIQLSSDRLVAPRLMSNSAHLHPVVVIIALLAGAEFFGVIGLFVAVPAVAAARVVWLHYRAWASKDEEMVELEAMFSLSKSPQQRTTPKAEPPAETEPASPDAEPPQEAEEPADGDA